jgi:hypothetical protein
MTKYIYYEPVPGINEDGEEVTCDRGVTMTEESAINHQRWVDKQYKGDRQLTDQQLLDEFIVVNWAEKVSE